jgi:thiol-disulfide isomerase/thioredoxin
MPERLALAILITTCAWLIGRALTKRALLGHRARALGLEGYRPGRAAIVYFSAPGCFPCTTMQRPALAALQAGFGDRLQILEIDALDHPDAADAWGVLSVPTTFIINREGRPRRVNHGPARASRLRTQLAAIGERERPLTGSDEVVVMR